MKKKLTLLWAIVVIELQKKEKYGLNVLDTLSSSICVETLLMIIIIIKKNTRWFDIIRVYWMDQKCNEWLKMVII